MATTTPFNDEQNGAEIRERLNAMWSDWLAALETAVGNDGWSPLLRTVADGQRQVIELYDWFGGTAAKPATGFMGAAGLVATAVEAVDFRGPRGLKGEDGDIGPEGPANKLGVGEVTTGAPGTPVQVTITGNYPDQKINVTIPRGYAGDNGDTPTVTVGDVTTGAPGTAVEVTPSGTPTALVLNFKIPRGEKGENGSGTGDMLKSVYDSAGTGSVQRADKVPWGGIEDKPAVIAAGDTPAAAREAAGLGNVNNTADADKPVSTLQGKALGLKVDKVHGKGLSSADFTQAEKEKLGGIAEGAVKTWTALEEKPQFIGAGATQAEARTAIGAGTSSFSGSFNDLADKPTTPEAGLLPQNVQSAAYTLTLADMGKHVLHPAADTTARTFTIPANSSVAFPVGAAVTFVNQNGTGGVVTIAITADTLRLAGAGTTGSRTLARNGVATALKIDATEWIISGSGLT